MSKKAKTYTAQEKAKVVLEAIKIYDSTLGGFRGAPRRINDQLKQDSSMQRAIQKALEKYLGR